MADDEAVRLRKAIRIVIPKIAAFVESSYVRSIAKLSGSNVLASLIPFIAAPLLGRLYLPSDYGPLAIYVAAVSVASTLSTLQFHHAIMVENLDRRAVELVYLSTFIAAILSAISGILLFFGHETVISEFFSSGWILLLPYSIFETGIINAVSTLANRHARYGFLARVYILSTFTTVITSVIFGYFGFGTNGLFFAYFSGRLVTLSAHLWIFGNLNPNRYRVNIRKIKNLFFRYRNFPIYTLPSSFISVINMEIPTVALNSIGELSLLGAFSRTRQLISVPVSTIGFAIGRVFNQRASEEYRSTGTCRPRLVKTALALAVIGLPPMVLLLLFSHDFFRIFLGPNWTLAGDMAKILAPMLWLRLICTPLTSVFQFTGNQKTAFVLSVFYLFMLILFSFGPLFLFQSQPIAIVYGFSTAYVLIYLTNIVFLWMKSNKLVTPK